MPPMPSAQMGACPAGKTWSTCTISMYRVSMPETVLWRCSRPELMRLAITLARACKTGLCEYLISNAPASED